LRTGPQESKRRQGDKGWRNARVLPFVNQHLLLITALAHRIPQKVYIIALVKVLHVRADAQHNASPIIAHDMEVRLTLRQGLDTLIVVRRIVVHAPSDLDIDRIDGGCFHPDKHLSTGGR
jgi:hypothetical protein